MSCRTLTLAVVLALTLVASSANAMIIRVLPAIVLSTFAYFTQGAKGAESVASHYIGPSKIHGEGVMALKPIEVDENIGVGIDYTLSGFAYVTSLGKMINHSKRPNAQLKYNDDLKHWNILATKAIAANEEITVNYDETPWFIAGPEPDFVEVID